MVLTNIWRHSAQPTRHTCRRPPPGWASHNHFGQQARPAQRLLQKGKWRNQSRSVTWWTQPVTLHSVLNTHPNTPSLSRTVPGVWGQGGVDTGLTDPPVPTPLTTGIADAVNFDLPFDRWPRSINPFALWAWHPAHRWPGAARADQSRQTKRTAKHKMNNKRINHNIWTLCVVD